MTLTEMKYKFLVSVANRNFSVKPRLTHLGFEVKNDIFQTP
jgi:hypothetical protein